MAGTADPITPLEPTPLIGRERELAALEARLREPSVRLLTLIGPPGVGKTRLALAAGDRLLPAFPDGVIVARLEHVADPATVPDAIAGALGLRESGDRSARDRVVAATRTGARLLVLDTFEHLLPAAAWLATLLDECPGLTLLVTSRARLNLSREEEMTVSPLALPQGGAAGGRRDQGSGGAGSDYLSLARAGEATISDAVDLMDVASTRLFVERARAARAGFRVEPDEVGAVAQICRRLDGLPLAIELAAARVRFLSPREILERLDDRFALLGGGPRDRPERHRALRAALEWSHDLLAPDERRLFRRMSVFAGGCTVESLEALVADAGDFGPDPFGPIAALAGHSLVGRDDDGRLRMLESIRLYAAERLDASGEEDPTRAWHARFFLGVALEAERRLTGPEQVRWLTRLDAEQDNLRAALDWARRRDPELALELAGALWRSWRLRGAHAEGRLRLEQALARAPGASPRARATALHGVGSLAIAQGDLGAAREPLEQSLALRREAGDLAGAAAALNDLGNLATRRGEREAAHAAYVESLDLARQVGDDWTVALALNNHGHLLAAFGDPDAAEAAFREALTLARALGDRRTSALALHNLATLARERGALDRARSLHGEALSFWRELGDRFAIAAALNHLAVVSQRLGATGAAVRLYAESLVLLRELGDAGNVPANIGSLGTAALALGQVESSARLLGAAQALTDAAGGRLLPEAAARVEASRSAIWSLLGDRAAEEAWRAGAMLSPERAADEALTFALAVPANARVEPTGAPAARFSPSPAAPRAPTVALSKREREVVRLLVEGKTNREIAEGLVLSIRTVESHIFNVYAKIGARGRAEAVAFALRHGLV